MASKSRCRCQEHVFPAVPSGSSDIFLFFVSSLSSLLALVDRAAAHGMFAGPNHLRQSLVILDAVSIESLLSESDLTPFMLHLKEAEQLVLKFGKTTGYVKYYINAVCCRFFALKIIYGSEIELLSSFLKALHIIVLFYLFMI